MRLLGLLQVRTGVADEKAAALYALGIYGKATGAAFLPHAEQATSLAKANLGAHSSFS